jgi:MipA family protein
MRWLVLAGMVAAGLACATGASAFDDSSGQPLFEVGIFGGTLYAPDYPASNQSHIHFLPLPYVIYRGHYFQVDEKSVRGVLLDDPRFSLDLSASASFETGSNDTARRGMPSLDYLGEAGPRLRVLLAHDARNAMVDFELPLRVVISTNFTSRLDYRGVVTAPEFAYTNGDFLGSGGTLKLGLSTTFATQELMSYFYDVAPRYVVPGRPQYSAKAGYLGSGFDVSYRYPVTQRLTLFSLADAAYYGGASNASSPLFKSDFGLSVGFGATFSFYASDERAGPLETPEVPNANASMPPAYGLASPADLGNGSADLEQTGPHVARPAPRQIAVAEPPPTSVAAPPAVVPPTIRPARQVPSFRAEAAMAPPPPEPVARAGLPRSLVSPVASPETVTATLPPQRGVATRQFPLLAPGGATDTASSDGAGIE